jgi:hypothetical protein
MARISVRYGWNGAFFLLAGVAFLSGVAGLVFLLQENAATVFHRKAEVQ